MEETNVDVLVVGAGPAGLMCALGLARAGVNVRIIDNRTIKVAAGQADGIQPRTIEVFQSYGIASRLLEEGNQMHMAAFYNPSVNGGIERTSRAPDVNATNARYPFEITLHQGAIEAIFIDALRKMNVEIDRPVQPVQIDLSENVKELNDPQSYAVKVTLERLETSGTPNVTEIVRAKYVVGTDGAHSWVRKSFGINMDGEHTDYVWGVVDIIPETDFPDIRNKCAIHSHNGSCLVIPREGDKVRLYIQLTDSVVDGGRIDKSSISPEKLLAAAKKSFYPYQISVPKEKIDWWTIYIIGQRVASQYSVKNRVFIAGDACHTHSPKAGQGMNASMNDSHNLVWKLAYVLRGWASPALLVTYEFERRRYAQDLINFDKSFSALFSGKPFSEKNQDGVSHKQFLDAFQTFGGFTSGIGVSYGDSIITNNIFQLLAPGLVVGMRISPQILIRVADARPFELQDLLPSDSRFKVIIFAGDPKDKIQRPRLAVLSEELEAKDSFLQKHCINWEKKANLFDIIVICGGKKETIDYTDVNRIFKLHWTKIFVDDVDLQGLNGGKVYSTYGISADGLVAIIRPDGYVGIVAPIDKVSVINEYFKAYLNTFVVDCS